jgi:hypothetical protein
VPPATRLLALGSAAGTAALDWRHRHRLRPVFGPEAALEVAFAAAAAAALVRPPARPVR